MSVKLHHVRSFLWPIRRSRLSGFRCVYECYFVVYFALCVFLITVKNFCIISFIVCVIYALTNNHSFSIVSLDYLFGVNLLPSAICTNMPNWLCCPYIFQSFKWQPNLMYTFVHKSLHANEWKRIKIMQTNRFQSRASNWTILFYSFLFLSARFHFSLSLSSISFCVFISQTENTIRYEILSHKK